jgi:hypothetical protein
MRKHFSSNPYLKGTPGRLRRKSKNYIKIELNPTSPSFVSYSSKSNYCKKKEVVSKEYIYI